MNADILAFPLVPDEIGDWEADILDRLAKGADRLCRGLKAVNEWENEQLLDNPSPRALERHKALVTGLIRFSKLLAWGASNPEFQDSKTKAVVAAAQAALLDKLAMWHGPTPESEREEVLQKVFGES